MLSLCVPPGAATIALKVANMVDENGTSLLLALVDCLSLDVSPSQEDFVKACSEIQNQKLDKDWKKDPRFIIPAVSIMKRVDLVKRLPEFISASDSVFKAALEKMSERVGRQALAFREETEKILPTGMTLCEQLVYLHSVDFSAAGIPQKRYLDAIRLCLDDEEAYTDRVVMSALEKISLDFLKSDMGLPLAYMRTIILTCSKHDTLHPWICQVLLPRLVEGKIYNDRRQWEVSIRLILEIVPALHPESLLCLTSFVFVCAQIICAGMDEVCKNVRASWTEWGQQH